MSKNRDSAIKLSRSGYPAVTGLWTAVPVDVTNEKKLQITVRDVNASNEFEIQATSGVDPVFSSIATITGNQEMQTVDVSVYDKIRIYLNVRDPANSDAIFYLSSTIEPPGGFGQETSANSSPVVLSTEQEAILSTIATGIGVLPTLSLGAGVVDATTQRVTIGTDDAVKTNTDSIVTNTGNTSTNTSNIDAKLPATLGQKTKAGSLAVTLASDEDQIDTNIAQLDGNTIDLGSGNAGAGTQRVILADDSPGGSGGSGNAIDANNSTSSTLAGGASFTGTGTDVTDYTAVNLQIFADQDSAADGVKIQTSTDNVNWTDHAHEYDYEANASRHYEAALPAQYYRVVYTNGGSAQGTFRMQAKLLSGAAQDHVHSLDHDLNLDHPAKVVRSIIAGETTAGGGGFVNVKVNPSGTLEVEANQGTHDSLNCNSTIQIQDTDVSLTNGVPIKNETGGSIAVTAASLPLPSGAATAANQSTINTSVQSVLTELQLKADLTETQPVSAASLPLPTGASTEATQLLAEAHLGNIDTNSGTIAGDTTSIDGKTPSLGAATTANSTPVNIASDQTVPVSAVSLPLPTGAATAANQLPDGHNVTVDNAAGASAVNIQDGGNSITVDDGGSSLTVDGTVGVSGTVTVDSELPAASTLSDNMSNPSAPSVRSNLMGYDGSTWDRLRGDSTNGLLVNLGSNNDVIQSTASNLNAQVVGNVANSAADSGNPVKVGGKAIDWQSTIPTEQTSGDRMDLLTTLRGLLATTNYVERKTLTPTNLNTTYDTTDESQTSGTIDIRGYREASLKYSVTRSAGTPTTIQFLLIQMNSDGSTEHTQTSGIFAFHKFDDAIFASEKSYAVNFLLPACDDIKIKVETIGTDASNTFTVADLELSMMT